MGLAFALVLASPATFALYYGPSFTAPTAISPGSDITITVTTVSSTSFVAPPAGSNPPCSGTCNYPLQSCTNAAQFYIAIHLITVQDPNGNQYMLGSATTSGLYWPANQGGGDSNNGPASGQANELNITGSQSDTISFGTGQTGVSGASFASENYHVASPFTATPDTAGPYYWWTVAGNSYGSNLRLDQHPSITPTVTHGTYLLDIEGVAVCGQNTTPIQRIVFFDAGIVVITPEFGSSAIAVAGVALLLLMAMRRGAFSSKLSTV